MTSGRTNWLFRRERWLRRCGAMARAGRRELDLGDLVPLLEFLPPAPPPVGLLAGIEARVDMLERQRSVAKAQTRQNRTIRRTLFAGLTGAFVSAAAMTVVVLVDPLGLRKDNEPVLLADLAGSAGTRVLRAETVEDGRYLRLRHVGPPIAADRDLELWLIPGGVGVPRSLGLLAARGNVTVLPLEHEIRAGDVLALSEEPAGGSPTGGPTGPVLIQAFVGPFSKHSLSG